MLTVLHATDYLDDVDGEFKHRKAEDTYLTKQYTNNLLKLPATNPRLFQLGKAYVPDTLPQTFDILKLLEPNPRALVIRYEFHSKVEGDLVYRRGSEVLLTKSKIIALDVDGLLLPAGMKSTDLISQAKYVVGLLNELEPEVFQPNTGFIVQGSSSAGLSDKIKIHLWLQNKSEVNQLQLKNFFYRVNRKHKSELIDISLYNTVQPHYTAKPIFANIEHDPFKGGTRTFIVKGSTCFIPASYPEYVAAVKASAQEISSYLSNLTGTTVFPVSVLNALQVLRGWVPQAPGARISVISLFHNAIQEQCDLNEVEKQARILIERIRPGMSDDYIAQGKNAAMAHIKSCSQRGLPDKVKGMPVTELPSSKNPRVKFLNLDSLPSEGIVLLKASLGTGKTYTIQNLLSSGQIKGKFLSITDTTALVESNARRFNAGDFRNKEDLQDFKVGTIDRLSGTLHSLHKIKGLKFDFVFVDEADSVMNNLLFAPIISDPIRGEIIEVLRDLLNESAVCVLSDGDLSEQTAEAYVGLLHKPKPIYKIVHNRKTLEGVTAFQHISENSVWELLSLSLDQGKRCLLVSDSSPDNLNRRLMMLSGKHTDKNIEVVHANSKSDAKVRDIINNTTDALARIGVDALLCSPSVTNGVDFNYFDTVFVITKTDSHTPNMRFQALMRERQPKEIHYYTQRVPKFNCGYNNNHVDQGWLAVNRRSYAARREREYCTYKATFVYYLINAGARVIALNTNYSSPITDEDRENYLIQRTNAIMASSELYSPERHNDAFEIKKLIKSLYQLEEADYSTVFKFLKTRQNKALALVHTIADVFWETLSTKNVDMLAQELRRKGDQFFLLTGRSLATSTAPRIFLDCCINEDTNILEYVEMYKRYCIFYGLKPSEKIVNKDEIVDL
jgi:hypothetical protein